MFSNHQASARQEGKRPHLPPADRPLPHLLRRGRRAMPGRCANVLASSFRSAIVRMSSLSPGLDRQPPICSGLGARCGRGWTCRGRRRRRAGVRGGGAVRSPWDLIVTRHTEAWRGDQVSPLPGVPPCRGLGWAFCGLESSSDGSRGPCDTYNCSAQRATACRAAPPAQASARRHRLRTAVTCGTRPALQRWHSGKQMGRECANAQNNRGVADTVQESR